MDPIETHVDVALRTVHRLLLERTTAAPTQTADELNVAATSRLGDGLRGRKSGVGVAF